MPFFGKKKQEQRTLKIDLDTLTPDHPIAVHHSYFDFHESNLLAFFGYPDLDAPLVVVFSIDVPKEDVKKEHNEALYLVTMTMLAPYYQTTYIVDYTYDYNDIPTILHRVITKNDVDGNTIFQRTPDFIVMPPWNEGIEASIKLSLLESKEITTHDLALTNLLRKDYPSKLGNRTEELMTLRTHPPNPDAELGDRKVILDELWGSLSSIDMQHHDFNQMLKIWLKAIHKGSKMGLNERNAFRVSELTTFLKKINFGYMKYWIKARKYLKENSSQASELSNSESEKFESEGGVLDNGLPENYVMKLGLHKPLWINGYDYENNECDTLCIFGIKNPFGPTLTVFSSLRISNESDSTSTGQPVCLVYTMLNPFSQQAAVVGLADPEDEDKSLSIMIWEFISKNTLAGDPVFGSLPNFVIVPPWHRKIDYAVKSGFENCPGIEEYSEVDPSDAEFWVRQKDVGVLEEEFRELMSMWINAVKLNEECGTGEMDRFGVGEAMTVLDMLGFSYQEFWDQATDYLRRNQNG